MDKKNILLKITEILKDVAGVHGNVNPATKLKIYLPSLYSFAFATEVHQVYNKTDLTDLAKSLYDPIVNLNDLTDYIYKHYEKT